MPTDRLVEKLLWQVEQCCGPLSREACVVEGDDDYSILRHNFTALLSTQETTIAELVAALEPFAAFDDGRAPESLPITSGSAMARKQLTIGDCRRAQTALTKVRSAL